MTKANGKLYGLGIGPGDARAARWQCNGNGGRECVSEKG